MDVSYCCSNLVIEFVMKNICERDIDNLLLLTFDMEPLISGDMACIPFHC